jgi:ABC-2 type transport system permease protein
MHTKRVSPMPIAAYFTAKIVMSVIFGSVIVVMLSTIGVLFGGVRLPLVTWVSLLGILIVGTLPFCAMGLVIGYLAGPNSATGIVNLIYLPLAFSSGLWIPIVALPGFFKTLAHALPPYHYSQLALKTIGADVGDPVWIHVTFLVVFTAVMLGLAYLAYRRDEGKTYG